MKKTIGIWVIAACINVHNVKRMWWTYKRKQWKNPGQGARISR